MSGGLIEEVSATQIAGWVSQNAVAYPEVVLKVNGSRVARTRAIEVVDRGPSGAVQQFFLNIRMLWDFVGPSDTLSVWSGDTQLLTADGLAPVAAQPGRRDPADLLALIEAGHVFNKKGGLQLSKLLNTDWQKEVLATFDTLKARTSELMGLDLFPCYGTLLGAVREQDFIGHDDDFDCAFISSGQTPRAARDELLALGGHLVAEGFNVWPGKTCLKVSRPGDNPVSIDIFHSFFDEKDDYLIPFGIAGTTPYRREDLSGWDQVSIGDHAVSVPANAEKLLAWLYGPNWRVPDPGFNWARERKISVPTALPSLAERAAIYWDNANAHTARRRPTAFCLGLAPAAAAVEVVVDLGCGSGRDATAFAEVGRHLNVVGVDIAPTATTRGMEKARKFEGRLTFERADLAQPGEVGRVLQQARSRLPGARVMIYARWLLDVMTEDAANSLLTELAANLEIGDVVALEWREFSAAVPEQLSSRGFKRRVDQEALLRMLESNGLAIVVHDRAPPAKSGKNVEALQRLVLRRR